MFDGDLLDIIDVDQKKNRGQNMARKKKIEPIISLGNEDKLTVQKSKPLFALWRSDLTLAEFKILDTYLARIDSHHPEKRAVMFEKGELEKILGVNKINNEQLKERLKHLMGHVVEIPDKNGKKGFRLITLFEEAVAEQDDDGLWQVKMECTQKAMKYIFNIENLGYYRYKLRCITSLTSRYTYIMFIYLEANRFRKSWEVSLNELKQILKCDQEALYQEYKRFNERILKKVQKEMHEKTECRYSYEPIKKGRRVVAIRFTLESLNNDLDAEITKEKELELNKIDAEPQAENWIEQYCKLCDGQFTSLEMNEFVQMTHQLPLQNMYAAMPDDDLNAIRGQYIISKYAQYKTAASRTQIKHPYGYFKKLIQSDIEDSKKQKNKNINPDSVILPDWYEVKETEKGTDEDVKKVKELQRKILGE